MPKSQTAFLANDHQSKIRMGFEDQDFSGLSEFENRRYAEATSNQGSFLFEQRLTQMEAISPNKIERNSLQDLEYVQRMTQQSDAL